MHITAEQIEALRTADQAEREHILAEVAIPRLAKLSPLEQALQAFHWVKNAATGDLGILWVGAPTDDEGKQVYLVIDPEQPGKLDKWPAHDVLTTDLGKIEKPTA